MVGAGIVVLALALRDYSTSHPTAAEELLADLPELPEQLAAQSTAWHWVQSDGDSTRIEASAQGFTRSSDGRAADLRGVVLRIHNLGDQTHDRVESDAMRMLDDGRLRSAAETLFLIGMDESGEDPAVVARALDVTFDPSSSSALTESRVNYEFARGRGNSMGAEYHAPTSVLRMLSDVQMEFEGRAPEDAATLVTAGGMRYAEGSARIELTSGLRVEQGPLWIQGIRGFAWLVDGRIDRIEALDAECGQEVGDQSVRFSAKHIEIDFDAEGAAQHLSGRDAAVLESLHTANALTVRGDTMHLRYKPGPNPGESQPSSIEVRGNAKVVADATESGIGSRVEASALRLGLDPSTAAVTSLQTLRRGRLVQFGTGEVGTSRVLEAGRIVLRFAEGAWIEALEATGAGHLAQHPVAPDAPVLHTWSERLEAAFDPETGTMASLEQSGAFRFSEGQRNGKSAIARFDAEGGSLWLDEGATIAAEGRSISAQRVELQRDTGGITAEGGVTATLTQEAGASEGQTPSMFGGGGPLYVAADAMRSDPKADTVEYSGGARVWQGGRRIDAETISMNTSDASLEASGGVLVAWGDPSGEAQTDEPPVSVRAQQMRYAPELGAAVFDGMVDMHRAGMRLRAEHLRTGLAGEGGDGSEAATAQGQVQISMPSDGSGVVGYGNMAEIDDLGSAVELRGEPARLIMADGTETRGGALTFSIAGDSLRVSGYGADRAYTYRPAAR